MVYIVGVDHLVQYAGPLPESVRGSFKEYIHQCVARRGIRVIAEEFSEESLHDVYHSSEGTLLRLASEMLIEHRYCDPEAADRRKLGIPYFHDLREGVKDRLGARSAYFTDCGVRKTVDREASSLARRFWRIREEYWLERIRDVLAIPVLFVCGHEHAAGFHLLVTERGADAEVLEPFWSRELFRDYDRLFSMRDIAR
jgi:hypothetical protein